MPDNRDYVEIGDLVHVDGTGIGVVRDVITNGVSDWAEIDWWAVEDDGCGTLVPIDAIAILIERSIWDAPTT